MAVKDELIKAILQDSLDLIRQPEHWTQRAEIRDSEGNGCLVTGGHATTDFVPRSFCALGAIYWVVFSLVETGNLSASNSIDLVDRSADLLMKYAPLLTENEEYYPGLFSLSTFNDTHEHSDVVRLFERAIYGE